ncbi:MAG: hypothetical protein HXY24_18025 [Rubrivivax sp.]|nr:hypothetical protein [Rubrivivax sp.]
MHAWFGDGQMRDPDLLSYHFDTKRIPATNRYRYSNPAVDKLLDDARSTPDRGVRDRLYREAQKILATDAPGIPVFYPVIANAYSNTLLNFQVYKAHDEYPLWTELAVK